VVEGASAGPCVVVVGVSVAGGLDAPNGRSAACGRTVACLSIAVGPGWPAKFGNGGSALITLDSLGMGYGKGGTAVRTSGSLGIGDGNRDRGRWEARASMGSREVRYISCRGERKEDANGSWGAYSGDGGGGLRNSMAA
jgi:hypothetical protein